MRPSFPLSRHLCRGLALLAASLLATCLGAQTIQTVAGGAPEPGQTYPATQTSIVNPVAAVADGQGNLYVASESTQVTREILKITPAGQMMVYAGDAGPGTAGDGGPASSAELQLGAITGMAVDAAGDLFFPDGCRVREINASTGIITNVAGIAGECGYAGDGGAATSAELHTPYAVALDAAGDLFIADTLNYRIREVNAVTGIITTIAGTGGAAVLSGASPILSGTATQVPIGEPFDLAVDSNGNVYFPDTSVGVGVIWKFTASTGQVAIVAGQPPVTASVCSGASDVLGDGCPATQAVLSLDDALAVDSAGDLYISDNDALVREVSASSGVIQVFAGTYRVSDDGNAPAPGDGGSATSALLDSIHGIATDAQGNVYLTDNTDKRVRKVSGGIITTVAGNGYTAFGGMGGPALSGEILPHGVALDPQGDLYVTGNADIEKVTAPGTANSIMTNIAGTGWGAPASGDGGPATQAVLDNPVGIAVDGTGDVIFADQDNNRIREINAATGVMTTLVGGATSGYAGDGGPASAAEIHTPSFLILDPAGDIFFSDQNNNVVREITTNGLIHTVAGDGTAGYSGDGGPAAAATLKLPAGLALDTQGDLYIADAGNAVVREVNAATGIITTIAGNGTIGLTGMNGPATAAELYEPYGVGVDGAGNVFITDFVEGVLLEVLASDGTIHLLAGNGAESNNQYSGAAANAGFCDPEGLISDVHGNVYFADDCGDVVREIETQPATTLSATSLSFGAQLVGAASAAQTVIMTNSGGVAMSVSSVAVSGAGYTETDTCTGAAGSIAPGASCTISATFTPSATGIQPGSVTITDNGYNSPLTVTLAGTGIAPAVSLSPASLDFGSQQLLAVSTPQTVTVNNPGTAALAISTIAVTGPFTQTNTCGSSLAAGATCTVAVAFAPTAVGAAAGQLTLNDSAANSPQSVALSGVGVAAPQLSLSASSLTFASQGTGTTSDAQTVIVSNTGNAAASFSGINVSGPFTETNSCGTSLAANATCTVAVVFAPTATNAASGTLTLTDNATGSPQAVSLSGAGIGAGVSLSPSSLNFGGQTVSSASAPLSLTITNTSAAVLTITSTGVTAGFTLAGNCTTVQPGASCSLGVTFTPAASGAVTGTLTLQDNAAGGTQTVPLIGLGTAAGVSLAPGQLSFAPITIGQASFPQTVTLSNTGNASLTGIAIPGAVGDFAVSANQCGATLAAGASCTFQVAVTPTVVGADTATLALSDSLGTQAVALSATGVALGLTQSSNAVNFGSQTVGFASNALTVAVTNPSSSAIALTGIAASPADFTQTNNCGSSVAAGATCTVNITFTPSASGAETGTVTITRASGSALTIAMAGAGVQGLALEPSSVAFGNQAVDGESQQQTVNILNTGVTAFTLSTFQTSGDFVVTQNLCTQTVAPGSLCQIFVAYAPSATGASTGALTVTDSTGVLSATVALGGQGTLAGIAASPSTAAFGSAVVDQTSDPQTITVANNGTTPVTIQALTTEGDFSVVGSTCLASGGTPQALAAGAACVVSLTMQPSSLGTRTGTLVIANDASGTLSVALTGSGQGANLTAEPSSLAFGSVPVPGSVAALTAVPQVVTVTNNGTSALGIASIAMQGGFSQSNTCGAALAAGASCTISVGFAPSALGAWQGLLTINTADGASHTVTLSGLGSPNGLVMSPATLNFGGVAVGQTSAAQTATLTNNTGSTITDLAVTASGEFSQTNTCGTSLAAGANCTISVTVTPALNGGVTGSLAIAGEVGGGASPGMRMQARGIRAATAGTSSNVAEIALVSSGNPASLTLSAANLSFGSEAVGTASAAQTVTVSNSGASAVTGVIITATPDFPFTTTCTAMLGASATCTVSLTFQPTASGNRTGTLTITGSGGLQSTLALSGTATGSNLAVSPGSLAFGARAEGTTSAAESLTLQNTGSASLTLNSVASSSADFAVAASTCGTLPAPLAAGASCTLGVTFTPSTTGSESAVLSIASNAANGTVAVGLTGSGSTSGLTFSAASLAFGNQSVGSASAAQTLTLTNAGSAAVAISSIGASAGFTQTNNCGGSVAAGGSCAVQVVFQPSAAGAQTGTLMIADSGAIQAVVLSGTGTEFQFAATTSSATVDAGGTATFMLALTPGPFTGAVALACSGAPANSICTVNPASVNLTAGGAAATATVTLATVSRGTVPALPPTSGPAPWEWMALAVGALVLLVLAALRQARRRWLLGAALGLALAAAACGGANNLPTADGGTPPGTYPIVITATSGTAHQTVSLTAVVY